MKANVATGSILQADGCSTYYTLVIRYVYTYHFPSNASAVAVRSKYEVFCAVRHVYEVVSTHQAKQYATSSNDVARG